MFENFVFEKLKALAGDVHIRRRLLRVSGMGESAVDELIAPIYTAYKTVQTSTLFNQTEIEVHLAARADSDGEADELLDEIVVKMAGALGPALFTTDGELMEEVIGRLLKERGETLSVAESCTGGLIGMHLTEGPGSSAYFMEGAITYSNAAKVRDLGVPEQTLEQFGAVSAETAEAMATGMRERAGTDHAISVTGIAGPDGGSEQKPVGTVFVGYSTKSAAKSMKVLFPGDRNLIRWRASQAALDYLRRQILKSDR
jgi:nicotinamide-nucleotide amidase